MNPSPTQPDDREDEAVPLVGQVRLQRDILREAIMEIVSLTEDGIGEYPDTRLADINRAGNNALARVGLKF